MEEIEAELVLEDETYLDYGRQDWLAGEILVVFENQVVYLGVFEVHERLQPFYDLVAHLTLVFLAFFVLDIGLCNHKILTIVRLPNINKPLRKKPIQISQRHFNTLSRFRFDAKLEGNNLGPKGNFLPIWIFVAFSHQLGKEDFEERTIFLVYVGLELFAEFGYDGDVFGEVLGCRIHLL